MKTFISIFTVLLIMMFYQNTFASQPKGSYTYKTQTGDVGSIETTAASKSEAFRLAADECFSRRVSLYEAKRGPIDEERALDFIDSCANLPY
ncbi:hypothetical protein N9W41_01330 [bacterium]|nr:hypothetical protein [bacterium]